MCADAYGPEHPGGGEHQLQHANPPELVEARKPLRRGLLVTMTVRHKSPGLPVLKFVPPQTSFSLITPVTARLLSARTAGHRAGLGVQRV